MGRAGRQAGPPGPFRGTRRLRRQGRGSFAASEASSSSGARRASQPPRWPGPRAPRPCATPSLHRSARFVDRPGPEHQPRAVDDPAGLVAHLADEVVRFPRPAGRPGRCRGGAIWPGPALPRTRSSRRRNRPGRARRRRRCRRRNGQGTLLRVAARRSPDRKPYASAPVPGATRS